jgi:hypothetical protein
MTIWHNELDLRSIKSTMQMDERRCKMPELVRKETWIHVLAYNLICTIAAQAAETQFGVNEPSAWFTTPKISTIH